MHLAAAAAGHDPIASFSLTIDGQDIYAGKTVPAELTVDTTDYRDGKHLMVARARAASGAGHRCSRTAFFENGVGLALMATGADMATWTPFPDAPAKAVPADGAARIYLTERTWGAIRSPWFEIDPTRKPAVMLDVSRVDPKWWLKIQFQGGDPVYLRGDNAATGLQWVDIMSVMNQHTTPIKKPRAPVMVRLIVGPAGEQNASLVIRSMRVVYQR